MMNLPKHIQSKGILSPGCLIIFLFMMTLIHPVYSQEGNEDRDALSGYIQEKFGPDQELYRGNQYYNAYFQYIGNPYFPGSEFQDGSLIFNGIKYQDLKLRYDCFSQLLFLESSQSEEQYNQISLNTNEIKSFTLGNLSFSRLSPGKGNSAFYQVIKKEHLTCYIQWSREAIPLGRIDRHYLYEFTAPSGEYQLLFADQLYSFSGKKRFIAIFPDSLSSEIRKYMREKQFSFKNASPGEIEDLLEYLNIKLEASDS